MAISIFIFQSLIHCTECDVYVRISDAMKLQKKKRKKNCQKSNKKKWLN